jgi:hypothetical protein
MNKKTLFVLWGILFILCAGLGFIPASAGAAKGLMTTLSVLFFLPPALLLWQSDRETAMLIRNLSVLSLGVTMLTLILNFVMAVSSEFLGTVLHYILVIVSAPMICSGYWVLSLFLWACLLMVSLKKTGKKSV